MPPHPTFWRSILVLSSHLRLCLPSGFFLSLKPPHQNPVYASPLHNTCYMPRPFHSSRFDHHTQLILSRVSPSFTWSSSSSCSFHGSCCNFFWHSFVLHSFHTIIPFKSEVFNKFYNICLCNMSLATCFSYSPALFFFFYGSIHFLYTLSTDSRGVPFFRDHCPSLGQKGQCVTY